MTGSTKILTVSYGTFSCTLEGFDDPLGTMRELAEYFRDLAADDRYFGAEPPTPDVEMLQNIAQREVQRKVEARTSATGISLTQVEKTADAPVAERASDAPQKAPQTADPDTGPLTFDDDFLMADEPEDAFAVDPDAVPTDDDGPAETVAEKLRRIRAVVSRRPEDEETSFSEDQAPDAGGKRDRALSETIRQIQDDLSDDEDAMSDAAPAEDDIADAETVEAPVEETLATEAHAEAEVEAEEAEAEDDLRGDDGRTMSQLLESVSGRIEDAKAEEEPEEHASAPTSKPLSDANTDADVGRLLEETDNKLNEDGVVRRRQVISQMRAAVAATKADRAVTRLIPFEDPEEVDKKAYRNDLTDAVNKTKPLPDQQSTNKPTSPPLMLVSSQRVEDSAAKEEPAGSARKKPTGGFARFVEDAGATGIEELLEAAAAYTIFSKGQESFSRPEIMKRVAAIDPALSASREDGLRSFGQLLRQGKIQRLERGQFTIDQDTRFNPGNRIAGQ